MKKIIMISLLVVVIAAQSNAQVYMYDTVAYTTNKMMLTKSGNFYLSDSICKVRGHCFDVQERGLLYLAGYDYYQGSFLRGTQSEPDSLYKVVDVADSSYIIYLTPSEFHHCYRCNKDIETKKPPRYIRTIWKRDKK